MGITWKRRNTDYTTTVNNKNRIVGNCFLQCDCCFYSFMVDDYCSSSSAHTS